MPAQYIAIRDSCYARKRKKNGELTEQDKKTCKKMAAITYFKKTGKTVKEAHGEVAKVDEVEFTREEFDAMLEYYNFYGTLDGYMEES